MKKKITAYLLSGFVILAAVCPQVISASANSASPYWNGADGVGVYSADDNCPLQVKSEHLTFNITGLPVEGESYTSSVCAEYEFYNPTNGDITARLLFPFGAEPDYYSEIEENSDLNSLYGVTIDGEDACASLRYSFTDDRYSFNFSENSAYLHDTKQEFGNFNEDTPVYKVTLGEAETDYVAAFYTVTSGETIMISDSYANYERRGVDGDSISVMLALYKDSGNTFYVIGELPEITACELTMTETSGSGGSMIVTKEYGEEVEIFTDNAGILGEFLQIYNPFPEGDYSEVDWFNFTMYFLITGSGFGSTDYCPYLWYDTYLYKYMIRWYSYDMTVGAGETVINAVTAPTYPAIDHESSPYVYAYYYLLSPASTWDSFENLTITINAPYYLTYSSFDFTMTGSVEDGTSVYTATFETLPSEDLYFMLCESDKSDASESNSRAVIIICATVAAVIAAGAAVGIVFLVKHIKKKNHTSS